MAHFCCRTGTDKRRVYRFVNRRAALGFVCTSFFLIKSWAWLLSAEMAGDRSLGRRRSIKP